VSTLIAVNTEPWWITVIKSFIVINLVLGALLTFSSRLWYRTPGL
jgi:hypothetical protein